jgi:hypothetical protein
MGLGQTTCKSLLATKQPYRRRVRSGIHEETSTASMTFENNCKQVSKHRGGQSTTGSKFMSSHMISLWGCDSRPLNLALPSMPSPWRVGGACGNRAMSCCMVTILCASNRTVRSCECPCRIPPFKSTLTLLNPNDTLIRKGGI